MVQAELRRVDKTSQVRADPKVRLREIPASVELRRAQRVLPTGNISSVGISKTA
jgi:hypothetical protein